MLLCLGALGAWRQFSANSEEIFAGFRLVIDMIDMIVSIVVHASLCGRETGVQKTIFVVDDNDTNLLMAEEALEDQYRVMTLPSASKMFALLNKITPDLILLDIEMPEMNGFEALRILKTNLSHAVIPVIFLTGTVDNTIEAQGYQLGAVGIIVKPFSAPLLLETIKSHLK